MEIAGKPEDNLVVKAYLLMDKEFHLPPVVNCKIVNVFMAEQRRNTRNTKSAKVQPVNDYGRIQPQAPEPEEAVLGALMIEKDAYSLGE